MWSVAFTLLAIWTALVGAKASDAAYEQYNQRQKNPSQEQSSVQQLYTGMLKLVQIQFVELKDRLSCTSIFQEDNLKADPNTPKHQCQS